MTSVLTASGPQGLLQFHIAVVALGKEPLAVGVTVVMAVPLVKVKEFGL